MQGAVRWAILLVAAGAARAACKSNAEAPRPDEQDEATAAEPAAGTEAAAGPSAAPPGPTGTIRGTI